MADPVANKALFAFMQSFKPHYRICGGDLFDLRALRKKAGGEEQRESIDADYRAGIDWLKTFKPTHLLRGNHDERLWDKAAENSGPLSDYCRLLVGDVTDRLVRLDCEMFPYHKRLGVLKIGHLKFLHGFFCGVTAARQTAVSYGSALFGHGHAIDVASASGFDRRVARMVGCLCRLDMDYNRASVNSLRYAHGFAYGVIDDKTGNYTCFQCEGVDGKFYFAEKIGVA